MKRISLKHIGLGNVDSALSPCQTDLSFYPLKTNDEGTEIENKLALGDVKLVNSNCIIMAGSTILDYGDICKTQNPLLTVEYLEPSSISTVASRILNRQDSVSAKEYGIYIIEASKKVVFFVFDNSTTGYTIESDFALTLANGYQILAWYDRSNGGSLNLMIIEADGTEHFKTDTTIPDDIVFAGATKFEVGGAAGFPTTSFNGKMAGVSVRDFTTGDYIEEIPYCEGAGNYHTLTISKQFVSLGALVWGEQDLYNYTQVYGYDTYGIKGNSTIRLQIPYTRDRSAVLTKEDLCAKWTYISSHQFTNGGSNLGSDIDYTNGGINTWCPVDMIAENYPATTAELYSRYWFKKVSQKYDYLILCYGNSITKTLGRCDTTVSYPEKLQTYLLSNGIRAKCINLGVGGYRTSEMDTNFNADILGYINSNTTVIALFFEFGNDIFNGATPAQTFQSLKNVSAKFQAQSVISIGMTAPDFPDNIIRTDLLAANELFRNDTSAFDYTIDQYQALDATIMDDTEYSCDKVHLTDAGVDIQVAYVGGQLISQGVFDDNAGVEFEEVTAIKDLAVYDKDEDAPSGDCRDKTAKYVGLGFYQVTEGNYQVVEGSYLINKE